MGDANENRFIMAVPATACACTCSSLFGILFGIYATSFVKVLDTINDFSISTGDKITIDWNKPLISDIYFVDAEDQCEGIDQPILTMPWFGLHHVCASTEEEKVFKGFACYKYAFDYKH